MSAYVRPDGTFRGAAILARYGPEIAAAVAESEEAAISHGCDEDDFEAERCDSFPSSEVTSRVLNAHEIDDQLARDFGGRVIVGYVECANYFNDAVFFDLETGKWSGR